ncbi:hypothetical protein ACQP00_22165 [Dactylosporangium sp. CS-047395]|uniref:hypothetical protein n=1 Tax=Dactylosporangium sp. CS-047395 TaxID=3239936 RepID=UPI003D8A8EC1
MQLEDLANEFNMDVEELRGVAAFVLGTNNLNRPLGVAEVAKLRGTVRQPARPATAGPVTAPPPNRPSRPSQGRPLLDRVRIVDLPPMERMLYEVRRAISDTRPEGTHLSFGPRPVRRVAFIKLAEAEGLRHRAAEWARAGFSVDEARMWYAEHPGIEPAVAAKLWGVGIGPVVARIRWGFQKVDERAWPIYEQVRDGSVSAEQFATELREAGVQLERTEPH